MLKEWAFSHLLWSAAGGGPGIQQQDLSEFNKYPELGNPEFMRCVMDPESNSDSMMTGALIRAFSADRSPFLLDKQELHKSMVLIIADDENASVGVVLNWPSSKGLDIKVAGTNTGGVRRVTIHLDLPEQFQTTKKKSAMEMLRNFDPQDPPSSVDEEEESYNCGWNVPPNEKLWLGMRTW
jgi:hypothetical protein